MMVATYEWSLLVVFQRFIEDVTFRRMPEADIKRGCTKPCGVEAGSYDKLFVIKRKVLSQSFLFYNKQFL